MVAVQGLAEGASSQAASLEESSASLEELSSMTRQNSGNAEQANSAAREARDEARVLVAKDSDFFRNLIVPAVTAAGYDVTTVSNGREALRLRDAGEVFDLIISDINMPELDGFGLARAVREGGAWAELPMIALSSRSEPQDVERGREARSGRGRFEWSVAA